MDGPTFLAYLSLIVITKIAFFKKYSYVTYKFSSYLQSMTHCFKGKECSKSTIKHQLINYHFMNLYRNYVNIKSYL